MEKSDLKQIQKLFENNNKLIFKKFDAKIEQIDKRFEQIDARFEQIDARFEQIDARFDQIDNRFERIENRMDKHEIKFEKYTRLAEDRFTNLLNICTSLRSEGAKVEKRQESQALESRVSALEITVKDLDRRMNS